MYNRTDEYKRLLKKIGVNQVSQVPNNNNQQKPIQSPQRPTPTQKVVNNPPRRGCGTCKRKKGA